MSEIEPGMVDWPSALAGRDWFHFSGITCAISEKSTATVAAGCRAAKAAGMTVIAVNSPYVGPHDLIDADMIIENYLELR